MGNTFRTVDFSTLEGKVALITGASQGLGLEIARQLVSHGCNVIISSRNEEKLKQACASISGEGSIDFVVCDVGVETQCQHLIKKTVERFLRLDFLINNAGVNFDAALDEFGEDCTAIRKIMDINFLGAVYCTHAALKYLERTNGVVVAISSLAGHIGIPTGSGYAASKFALEGFFASIRIELNNKGICTLVVEPGGMSHNDNSKRNVINAKGQVDVAGSTQRYNSGNANTKKNPRRKPSCEVAKRIVESMLKREDRLYHFSLFTMLVLYATKILFPSLVDQRAAKVRKFRVVKDHEKED